MKRLAYFFVWLSNSMTAVHKSAKDMNSGYATEQVTKANRARTEQLNNQRAKHRGDT